LLPDGIGSAAHPHLLVIGSKEGTVYLVDRDNLGHFQPEADTQIVQSLSSAVGSLYGIPAYFNHTLYFSAAQDQLKAFSILDGLLSTAPVAASSATFAPPGTVPSISANGVATGILWTIDSSAQLHAFDAADLSRQLYQGSTGSFIKFSTPTIANGKVYVGNFDSLVVFGLQDPLPPSITAVVGQNGSLLRTAAPGSVVSIRGSNLAPRVADASNQPWPDSLDGVSVFVNGVAVPVGYASPGEIDVQVPDATKPGFAVLTVVTGNRVLPPVQLTVRGSGHSK
jgi:outer membrane protein assembly factor BamB